VDFRELKDLPFTDAAIGPERVGRAKEHRKERTWLVQAVNQPRKIAAGSQKPKSTLPCGISDPGVPG